MDTSRDEPMGGPGGGSDAAFIATLIDELRAEDVTQRLNAVQRLPLIAQAIGEERTRTELLPFVTESIDDEDEVLLALAGQLDAAFLPYVGGHAHMAVLLEPLEHLAQVEETVVRERAVESLVSLARACSVGDPLIASSFYPLVKRLAEGDWFTSRISATGLFAVTYQRLPATQADAKAELSALFVTLAKDDTPMVRRAAASHLGEFAEALEPSNVSGMLLRLFAELADDDQDSVRLLVVENGPSVAGLMTAPADKEALFNVLRKLAADKSWRVRYLVSDRLVNMAPPDMLPLFTRLLRDGEAEVRTAAAFQIAEVARRVGADRTTRELLPDVRELVHDANQHVRTAVASSMMPLAPIIGRAETTSSLLPMVLTLLKDDAPDVRLAVISHLDPVAQVIGLERLANDLLPAIVELAEDRNWRVRLATIEHMALLAKQLGRPYFDVDKRLGTLCIAWLSDSVYAVREAAIANLRQLVQLFGSRWAADQAIPPVLDMYGQSTSYLYRMTALHAVGALATVTDASTVESLLLPVLLDRACRDPVANVRLVATKMCVQVAPRISSKAREQRLRPALMSLSSAGGDEHDVDVVYHADQALASIFGERVGSATANASGDEAAATSRTSS